MAIVGSGDGSAGAVSTAIKRSGIGGNSSADGRILVSVSRTGCAASARRNAANRDIGEDRILARPKEQATETDGPIIPDADDRPVGLGGDLASQAEPGKGPGSALHHLPEEMPGGMPKNRHHDGQADEQGDRADHQPSGDDEAPGSHGSRVRHDGTDRCPYRR
jgi:hypothetical protein